MDAQKINSLVTETYGSEADRIEPLKGDASARRIYRIWLSGKRYIAVSGDNIAENQAFIAFTQSFLACGLPVPEIKSVNSENTTYILQDLGDTHLADLMGSGGAFVPTEDLQRLYRSVLLYLLRFQTEGASKIDFSKCYQYEHFGPENISWDLKYFYHRFVNCVSESAPPFDYLATEFIQLADEASQQPDHFFLYRDFQSKNIMVVDQELFFIDYQSGRRGALQYDLASILFDPYMNLPPYFRQELLEYYVENAGELIEYKEKFLRGFCLFAVIRLLQALGAYGFLTFVKKRKGYWRFVQPALDSVHQLLNNDLRGQFPRLSGLVEEIVLRQHSGSLSSAFDGNYE